MRQRIGHRLAGIMFVILSLLGLGLSTATPAAASAPVLLSGSSWLGGNGVNVCSNNSGGGGDPYCGSEYQTSNVGGAYWQCVELAQRLYQKRGWHGGIFAGVMGAKDIYDQASNLGMSRQANGSISSIVPGDMIIHGGDAPYTDGAGHVSIVDRVEGSTVHVVEQNTYNDRPRATYSLSGGTLSRAGTGTIRGAVHDPANQNAPQNPSGYLRAPSAISVSTTGRNIFYVGADNAIWQWSVQNGAWKNVKLGSTTVAAGTSPSAVYDSTTGRNVFYVGSDNAIWQLSVQGGQWVNVRLGGSVASGTSPSAVTDTATGRNIFYVGSDNFIWQLSVQGGQWSNVKLADAGGTTSVAAGTSPSAIVDSSTGRNVFYVGSDNLIWQWSVQSGTWNNFRLWGTGGVEPVTAGTSPTAISDSTTGRNIFYVGGGNQIYQWSVQGGTWHNFKLTGTGGNTSAASSTSPAAITDVATGRNVFYTGSDHLIWQWSIQNGEWHNFKLAGTGSSTTVLAGTSPGAVSDPSTKRNVFYFDNSLRLWQWSIQGSAWNNFKLQ